jgi:hypothetical protein
MMTVEIAPAFKDLQEEFTREVVRLATRMREKHGEYLDRGEVAVAIGLGCLRMTALALVGAGLSVDTFNGALADLFEMVSREAREISARNDADELLRRILSERHARP